MDPKFTVPGKSVMFISRLMIFALT